MTKTLYLMEDFIPDIPIDATVVSLKPHVSLKLEEIGRNYKILQDYYSEVKLRAGEEEYYAEQLRWIKLMDDFIRKRISICADLNLDLTQVHFNRMKYFVDAIIINCRILTSCLSSVKPSEVVVISENKQLRGPPSIYNMGRADRHSCWPLIEQFSREGIPHQFLARQCFASEPKKPDIAAPPFYKKRILKSCLKLLGIKVIYNFFYLKKYKKVNGKKAIRTLNLLFLDSGAWAIDEVIRRCLEYGHCIFKKEEGGKIIRISAFSENPLEALAFEADSNRDNDDEFTAAAIELQKETEIIEWINIQCGCDVSSLSLPYLRNFIESECRAVLSEVLNLKKFITSYKIDFVIFRATVGKNYPGALLASKMAGIPRVCFQHSVGPMDMIDWAEDELRHCDINFAMANPSKLYFEEKAKTMSGIQCRVYESPHYLKRIRHQIRSLRKKTKRTGRPVVIYVPAKLAMGLIHFNTMIYPMTWYFEHQKKLLQYFASRSDFHFIYKHTAGQSWVEKSIHPWLKVKQYPNVEIRKGPFTDFLPIGDRIIFDYPSTGLFETSAAGLPVLALYHAAMKIYKPMFAVFGKSLQQFENSEEAIIRIDQFLSQDPSGFCVNLRLSEEDPILRFARDAEIPKEASLC